MPITLIREWLITYGLDPRKDGSIEKRQLRQDYRGYTGLSATKARGRKEMFEKFRNQSEQVAVTYAD
jgi:hypothetical protein